MSTAFPFANPPDPGGKPGFADTMWVRQYVADELKKFEIIGDGIDVSSKKRGQLVLKGNGGASRADHPFAVTVSGNGCTVAPGLVAGWNATLGSFFDSMPVIGSTRLDATPVPVLAFASGFNGFIVLRMKFSKVDGGASGLPWSILAVETLAQTALVRQRGSISGVDAELDIVIAVITNGTLGFQNVVRSVSAYASFETIVASY